MNRLLAVVVPSGLVFLLVFFLLGGPARDQLFQGKGETGQTINRRSAGSPAPETIGPGSRGLESGAANTVTAVVLDYRGFDTLGEVTVLFVAVAGAGLVLAGRRRRRTGTPARGSVILRTASPWIFLFLFVVGMYIVLHGHLTPGGGFPGGALLAAGLVLLMAGSGHEPSGRRLHLMESLAGFSFVGVGLAGLFLKDSFLAHFGGSGTVGAFFSAPVAMLLYLIIGLKVAAELVRAVDTISRVEEPETTEVP